MAIQVLQLDRRHGPTTIPVREDVTGVMVVVLDADGCAVELLHRRRPADGLLRLERVGTEAWSDRGRDARVPPAAAGKITVIVPTRERPDDLRHCLESLVPLHRAGHQIVVVDNCPRTDRTAGVCAAFGITVVTERAAGLNRARN